MTRRPILVTGGAGFIGSHTCKLLSAAGYLPVVYDNLSRGNEKSVAWGPLVKGDIRDGKALARAITAYRPRAIIHFAALAYVGESVSEPAEYYSTNVTGTIAVLDRACVAIQPTFSAWPPERSSLATSAASLRTQALEPVVNCTLDSSSCVLTV